MVELVDAPDLKSVLCNGGEGSIPSVGTFNFMSKEAYREKLFKKQEGICHFCGGEMVLFHPAGGMALKPDQASFEHIFDKDDRRRRESNPVVLTHKKCNDAKNDQKCLERVTFHRIIKSQSFVIKLLTNH